MKAISPEDFAKEMGWGAKRVRKLAKELGACRVLGNRMALMPEDVQTILEAAREAAEAAGRYWPGVSQRDHDNGAEGWDIEAVQ